MNAAKKLRQLLEQSEDPEQVAVLLRMAAGLQLGLPFDLRRLCGLDSAYFELGVSLLKDWRADHHIASRSKLIESILARDRGLQQLLCHLGAGALN
ncbi:hypothetical protein [Chromobacterium phragmitis]|uniref:hypothetical protein n=1 Tax=Chromobacterium phragmitis TaxID=2202141 RepID=UPI0011AE3A1C|nr:hypothetical protein [Chromobacterium phragmitis]